MNSREIYQILNNDQYVKDMNFLGVYPIDRIPVEALSYPCCAVVNTKPHNHNGEHWISFIKTKENNGLYFDSMGFNPSNLREIALVLDYTNEWQFNDVQLQSLFSTVCGQYCIFFLTHIARGFTMNHIIHLINDCGDTFANDAFVFNYINNKYREFNGDNLKIVDLPFIFDQSANFFQ